MTSFEFGDVILVPFPFTDQTTTKKRPAVVVSSDRYHSERPDLILLAVTSQLRPSPKVGEVQVNDWKAAGLIKPSVLKPLITTIERRLVIKKLGSLSSDDKKAARSVLDAILGGD